MDGRLVTAQCQTADFPAVEETLRQWTEVEAVGSFREKSNNKKDLTTVFVTFTDEKAAQSADEKLRTIKQLLLDDKNSSEKQNQNSAATRNRHKNLAAEFMKFDSYEERKRSEESGRRQRGRGGRGGDRRGNGAPAENGNEGGDVQRSQSRRGGRGGRGTRGGRGGRGRGGRHQQQPQQGDNQHQYQHQNNQMRGGRGRGRGRNQQYQRLPPIEANAAFADNIPFGTTNDHLMELFSPFGRVLDINRLELMAMVCYDNPESVQQCIQHLNGVKVGNNYITVSSGVVRIPGNVAAYLGM